MEIKVKNTVRILTDSTVYQMYACLSVSISLMSGVERNSRYELRYNLTMLRKGLADKRECYSLPVAKHNISNFETLD